MSFKVCFIGAGSLGFTRKLVRDLLTVPEFSDISISFTDISEKYLQLATEVIQRDIDENGLRIRIQSTTNRRMALQGARYVFNCARIGGLDGLRMDIEIPLKYGITQAFGDTLCAGGIMYGQRGIHAILEFCKDIREVCEPDCLALNYVNPNPMVTWAMIQYGKVRTVGLCHGVMYGRWQIAQAFGVKETELDIVCAGINHMTWYLQVKYHGEDWTSRLLEAFEKHPLFSRTEKVRIDMMKRFGYYVTESNSHTSEYVPWYRKHESGMNEWLDCTTLDEGIAQDTASYYLDLVEERVKFEKECEHLKDMPVLEFKTEMRGLEHGSYIIESLETGRIYRGHFNVVNHGIISNLPSDAIVEVPGYVDTHGINIPEVGPLPLACAAACMSNIVVQRMAVEAAVSGDDMLLRQAMLLDPLTGAVCTPPEIWQLVDEMLVAEAQWLPQYTQAITQARMRLESGPPIVPKRYVAIEREKVPTLEDVKANRDSLRKERERQDSGNTPEMDAGVSTGLSELLGNTGFKKK